MNGGIRRPDFRVTVRSLGEHAGLIALCGELDLYEAPTLEAAFQTTTGERASVVADLREATFIDSTMLGILLRTQKQLRARGGELVLVFDDVRIAKLFKVTGFDQAFTIFGTLDEALAHVGTTFARSGAAAALGAAAPFTAVP